MRVRQGKLARLAQSAETLQRIGSAQTDALFKAVPVGVGAAAIASILLLAILRQLGFASWIGPAWSLFVVACALGHILLARAYACARPKGDEWRKWALWCSAVSFAEGLAWGWAPIGLATGGLEVELVVLAVTLAVAEGAMVAFGAYLPAFYALFFPATVPYALVSALSSNPLERLTSLLMLVFICAISALGYTTNRSFIQIVGLRIRTEEMALDLQKQKDIAEQEQEVAEAANVAKSSFLAAASHDLRQPIHALGMFVGALRGVPVAPKGRRIVEQIEASTAAMDGLFSALLDVSRLDAGVVAVEKRAFAIGPVLERLCRDHQEEARAKGVSLVWRRCSAMVWSDPVLIERVLRNLVSNAARYTDRGRIVIGCRRRAPRSQCRCWTPGSACRQSRARSNQGPRTGPCDRPAARQPPRLPAHAPFPAGPRLALRGDDPARPASFARSRAGAGERLRRARARACRRGRRRARNSRRRDQPPDRMGIRCHRGRLRRRSDPALAACPAKPALILCDYRLRGGESGLAVADRIRAEYNDTIPAILVTGDTAPDRLAEAEASGLLLMHKPVSNGKLRAAIVNLTSSAMADKRIEADLPFVK